jgi:type IV pilus assembly protein PilC
MFFSRISLSTLIELCRTLRHYLAAGLTLRDVFRQQAAKGPMAVRLLAGRISGMLERGESLTDALRKEHAYFPPLFSTMAAVGEESGNLPEIFGELERYYRMQQKLRRQFLSQIMWPAFELVAAVAVIGLMITILGILGSSMSPFGERFSGVSGGVLFMVFAYGSIAAVIGLYFLLTRSLRNKAFVDNLLLRIPVIGPTLQALALTRFCLALGLTLNTGMSILKAIKLTLHATGNAAYEEATPMIQDRLKGGEDFAEALSNPILFPEVFRNIVAVGEESGRLPEVMKQQSNQYDEEAALRLTILTKVAGWCVWLVVAALLIAAIFRIYLVAYLNPINEMLK